MRLSGTTTNDDDCVHGDDNWQDMNTGDLNVTGLTFTTDYSCLNASKPAEPDCTTAVTDDNLVEIRQINITLTAQLADDATVTKTLNDTVKVRNNRHYQAP